MAPASLFFKVRSTRRPPKHFPPAESVRPQSSPTPASPTRSRISHHVFHPRKTPPSPSTRQSPCPQSLFTVKFPLEEAFPSSGSALKNPSVRRNPSVRSSLSSETRPSAAACPQKPTPSQHTFPASLRTPGTTSRPPRLSPQQPVHTTSHPPPSLPPAKKERRKHPAKGYFRLRNPIPTAYFSAGSI